MNPEITQDLLDKLIEMRLQSGFDWTNVISAVEGGINSFKEKQRMAERELERQKYLVSLFTRERVETDSVIKLATREFSQRWIYEIPIFYSWKEEIFFICYNLKEQFSHKECHFEGISGLECPIPDRDKIYIDDITYCGQCDCFSDSKGDPVFDALRDLPRDYVGEYTFFLKGKQVFEKAKANAFQSFRPEHCGCDYNIVERKYEGFLESQYEQEQREARFKAEEEFEKMRAELGVRAAKRAMHDRLRKSAPTRGAKRFFKTRAAVSELSKL